MKKILIVSSCQMRNNTTGLIGTFLNNLQNLNKKEYEIDLFDIGYFEGEHNPDLYPVHRYHTLSKSFISRIIRQVPFVRSYYAPIHIVNEFKRLFSKEKYDIVLLYQVPLFANQLVDIAHDNGAKIIFYPWGSDVLRISESEEAKLRKAFDRVDMVVGAENSNTIIKAREVFGVSESKIKFREQYLSGIREIMEVQGILNRGEMSNALNISNSSCNIVCGYSGNKFQRHIEMINALAQNKSVLPKGYQIIFPMTYPKDPNYVLKLKTLCTQNGLNAVFFTDFLSNRQMAFLHLITDLFIEILPTDAGNAFMIEALFCANKIITGRWLNYRQFEQFGEPYYLINNVEELSSMIESVLTHKIPEKKIPQELIDMYTIPKNHDKTAFWGELFESM